MKWTDINDIAIELADAHPDKNPLQINFVDLCGWVLGLPGFDIVGLPDSAVKESRERVRTALASKQIAQTFVVLIPLGKDKPYSAVIRTFVTGDFMTGKPAAVGKIVQPQQLKELTQGILKDFNEIQAVFYDVTTKPPATCEWE